MVAADGDQPARQIIKKYLGKSASGLRDIAFYVVGTTDNIDKLDGPDGDAAFWRGVRSARSRAEGLEAAGTRPAFGWVTATPHGNEPAAGEAIARELYELAARTDCGNLAGCRTWTCSSMPVRNPDGRDDNVRTTAWAFDPNRDFGTQNQHENTSSSRR